MAIYHSQRERIRKYIDGVIERITIKDPNLIIQYNKFINTIIKDLGVNKQMVLEVLNTYFENERLIKVEEILINQKLFKNEQLNVEKEMDFLRTEDGS